MFLWWCLVVCLVLVWVENCLFVCFCLKCFYLDVFYQSFIAYCVKNPKTQKVENPKSLIDIIVFCHKHILPFTFILIALCIYERILFPMHSYLCGRILDICMIVINRSSNLPWMVSQWFCWSWDMHRLVPIYLLTLLFYCFCLRAHQM